MRLVKSQSRGGREDRKALELLSESRQSHGQPSLGLLRCYCGVDMRTSVDMSKEKTRTKLMFEHMVTADVGCMCRVRGARFRGIKMSSERRRSFFPPFKFLTNSHN